MGRKPVTSTTYAGTAWRKGKGGRTERYHYNGKNQLVRRVAGGDAWDYTYDLQGNLVREAGPEGERQYLYDIENRQIRVLSGGKEIQEDRYDGEGMRAGLTVNGKKSTFLYGNGDLYAEFDETGADVSRYIWGYGLAGLGYQEKFYGVHRDEQLSTGWITGGAGSLENAYEYDAFGVLLGNYGKVPGRLLYGGQQYDAEMEQYYLRARYYNPMIGRFMQEDTYRGDGLNLYAYCANNPVMYYDPSGRNSDCNHARGAKENTQQENVVVEDGTGNNIQWSGDKGIYSVAYEVELPSNMYPGSSDERHFQEANKQLYNAFQADPEFAQLMESIYPGIVEGVKPGKRGAFSRKAPTKDVTWHHEATRSDILQLIPIEQHRAKGKIQSILHPQGRGGMENWGGGRKRKK